MAITLNTTPSTYQSAHGDILFTAYSTGSINTGSYQNYKYVCDVYVDSTIVARQKVFPNPTNNRGLFNIGAIVRNYISTQFNPSSSVFAQEFGSGEFKISAQCKFGEEYNGVLHTNVLTDSARTYYNHYNGRLIADDTILDSYLNKVASNRPLKTSIDYNTDYHFIPYLPSSTTSFNVVIKTYNFSNTLVATKTISNSASSALNLLLFNVAPGSINNYSAGTISSTIKYYTVQIGSSLIYTFNLLSNCKYPTYTITWLNKLGGFESYDFTQKNQKSSIIEKKDYGVLPYKMDSSGNISYYTGKVLNDNTTVYSSKFTDKMIINSSWLTDDEYVWLKELMVSPIIYVLQSGYFIPVKITGTEYQEKQYLNDKLTNLELTIEYGSTLNAQYR